MPLQKPWHVVGALGVQHTVADTGSVLQGTPVPKTTHKTFSRFLPRLVADH